MVVPLVLWSGRRSLAGLCDHGVNGGVVGGFHGSQMGGAVGAGLGQRGVVGVAGLGEPVDGGVECVDVVGGGGDVVGSVVAAAVVDVRLHEACHMPQLVGVGPPAHRWLRASARAAAMATTISARSEERRV